MRSEALGWSQTGAGEAPDPPYRSGGHHHRGCGRPGRIGLLVGVHLGGGGEGHLPGPGSTESGPTTGRASAQRAE